MLSPAESLGSGEAGGPVVLNGVSIDADSVGLWGYGSQYRVRASDVTFLWAERGHTSRHPWILFALGIALIVIGGRVLASIIRWMIEGGVIWDVHVLMLVFLPLGGYLVYLSRQKGQVLRVVTRTGERTFPFSRSPRPEALSVFLVAAREHFRYAVERPPAPWR